MRLRIVHGGAMLTGAFWHRGRLSHRHLAMVTMCTLPGFPTAHAGQDHIVYIVYSPLYMPNKQDTVIILGITTDPNYHYHP
jgi:hypothetical protein